MLPNTTHKIAENTTPSFVPNVLVVPIQKKEENFLQPTLPLLGVSFKKQSITSPPLPPPPGSRQDKTHAQHKLLALRPATESSTASKTTGRSNDLSSHSGNTVPSAINSFMSF